MAARTDLIGVYANTRFRSTDSTFVIGFLEDGTCVKGNAEEGELIPGCPYQFFGAWEEHAKHGRQFKFQQFLKKEPHSRHGLVAYLERYAPNIGPTLAARLYDAFGSEAVKVLRTQPEQAAAACDRLTIEKAIEASHALKELVALEDTKIELTNLFAGRGFPGALVDACVAKWHILAPAKVRRDPFTLLVNGMTGCGFARCDRLYLDLGLPPDRLKRQVICLWHVINSDMSGNTWIAAHDAMTQLKQHVSGAAVKPKKAVRAGVLSGWLAKRIDAEGKWWLADGQRATNEKYLAERLLDLDALASVPPLLGQVLALADAAQADATQAEPIEEAICATN